MNAATYSRVIVESSVAQTLIRWRLNEVMARYDIRAKELAEEMDVSQSAISNLRKRSMPRLTEETLNSLCQALNKLSQEKTLITPGELIEYTPDPESPQLEQNKDKGNQEEITGQKQLKQSKGLTEHSLSEHRHSLFAAITDTSQSA